MWKDFRRPATTGIEGMTGAKAEVIENGRGDLKVFVRGEIWDAVAKEDLSVGQRVEIIGVERMRLVVRRGSTAASSG
jgi:membrane-bound ClpP family serine protease